MAIWYLLIFYFYYSDFKLNCITSLNSQIYWFNWIVLSPVWKALCVLWVHVMVVLYPPRGEAQSWLRESSDALSCSFSAWRNHISPLRFGWNMTSSSSLSDRHLLSPILPSFMSSSLVILWHFFPQVYWGIVDKIIFKI